MVRELEGQLVSCLLIDAKEEGELFVVTETPLAVTRPQPTSRPLCHVEPEKRACQCISVARIGMRRRDPLRLRRPAFPQEDTKDDYRGNCQELALPVLKRLEPELARTHEFEQALCRPAVLQQLFVVLYPAT